jgi:preprotein translocase subunit SecA
MLDFARSAIGRHDRNSGPYPERREDEPNAFDRVLIESFGRAAAKFERGASSLAKRVSEVDAAGQGLDALSDAGLRETAEALRRPLLRDGFQPELIARSFAVIREMAGRKLGMRHYPVQLMGGWALMEGRLAEMQTGEGKTLTASLPAATAALGGMPAHVVTVNDYLAERDAEELRPLYEALGLSVGFVKHGQQPHERRAAYACDICYCVNKEVAFDYLRDKLALGRRGRFSNVMIDRLHHNAADKDPLLLRGLYFAIVDEADSILIDEARTPLIIAGASGEDDSDTLYPTALMLADELAEGEDFELLSQARGARLTDAGTERLRVRVQGFGGLWESRRAREELVRQGLAARHLFHRDKQYVVVDGKVQIVDEFTGRIAEGRQWQHGLHQLIEIKEGCEATSPNVTRASITYQRFFRRYLHLAGMSGTLAETSGELRAVYGLKVVRIPTNRPSQRVYRGTQLFREAEAKRLATVDAARAYSAQGRSVLIGTRSVVESESLGTLFKQLNVEHVVLNAHYDAEEAAIVAQAGNPGRITIATSMAGRGTDIKLAPEVKQNGGLHVMLTEFSESKRVDRQLIGRGGRQGDPSTYEELVALSDELFTTFAPRAVRLTKILLRGSGPFEGRWAQFIRWRAQARAEKHSYQARCDTLRAQRHMDKTLGFAAGE